MYSPKIKEEYIPTLYQIAKTKGVPMTHLVCEALEEYLNKPEIVLIKSKQGEIQNDN